MFLERFDGVIQRKGAFTALEADTGVLGMPAYVQTLNSLVGIML